jgi:inosose dehydratase
MTELASRIAGAPISLGVCEVPGWGHQMAPDRVLTEMSALGLAATEFGPLGFLPYDPHRAAALLAEHDLRAAGGFEPVVLFDPAHDPLPAVQAALRYITAAGGGTLVLAAVSGLEGYDERPQLDDQGWKTLLTNLDRIAAAAAALDIEATLHPHVGTMVENAEGVNRILDQSTIQLCLDTGHLLVGGTDPVSPSETVPRREGHVHLKDEDIGASLATEVRAGALTYTEAVRAGAGSYRPLGRGDVDSAAIVRSLEASDYQGWYVMEQDTVLDSEPTEGEGPLADVRVLRHATYHYRNGLGVDESVMWGDYFLVEALDGIERADALGER